MIPPEKRVWWRWHSVNYGETLFGIAKQLHSTPQAIAEVNNLDPQQPLREAAELVIPVSPAAGSEISHQVQAKETLASVARRYRVSPADLMTWNNLPRPEVRPGMTLIIPTTPGRIGAPVAVPAAAQASRKKTASATMRRGKSSASPRASVIHKVRKGESLAQIAANHNVSVEALKQRNSRLGESLRIGAEIIIPAAK